MAIQYLQKVCDAYDWFDSDIDRIVRRELKEVPSFHRKQWEFAIIFHSLERSGKLHAHSRGIALGAGDERLIYAIANNVGHLTATDLYKPDSHWLGARTASPKEWLLHKAPFPVSADKLDAQFMDMNYLEWSGPKVDFCYSSCSFEHIGTELSTFTAHLDQVAAILADDGIYVFTTELNYGPTIPMPHSFFFSPEDLIKIVADLKLTMESVIDVRLNRATLNMPSVNLLDVGSKAWQRTQSHVTPYRSGHVFTSVNLVLSKKAQPGPQILDFEKTRLWLAKSREHLDKHLWTDWQHICTKRQPSTPLEQHAEFVQEKPNRHATGWLHFGPGRMLMRVASQGGLDSPARVNVHEMDVATQQLIGGPTLYEKRRAGEIIKFDARPDRVYKFAAFDGSGDCEVSFWLKREPAA